MYQVILKNGSVVPLSIWQKQRGLSGTQISKNFSLNGDPKLKDMDGNFSMSEILIELVQRARNKWGKPLTVNAGCRTQEQQNILTAKGLRTAKITPHIPGMAQDLDTSSNQETALLVKILNNEAFQMGISIRLGWKDYQAIGQTFVHVDVCPEYYASGKPYHKIPHPKAWEIEQEW